MTDMQSMYSLGNSRSRGSVYRLVSGGYMGCMYRLGSDISSCTGPVY